MSIFIDLFLAYLKMLVSILSVMQLLNVRWLFGLL